jgi:MarR family transcriptional regulator, temperature-dependent positive regulator of motility
VPDSGPMSKSRLPEAEAFDGSAIHPLIAVKLWENPCWLSFRINYLALRFNGPVYGRIAAQYGLSRPDYLVLYSLYLRDGIAASDVCATAGFPKNTISRAIHRLVRQRLVRRSLDPLDRRSYLLHLTAESRRILDDSVPPMVAHEKRMLSGLSKAEQETLSRLLARLVVDSPNWPTEENREQRS